MKFNFIACACAASLAGSAAGQSYNIDFGDPRGNDKPASSYAAAGLAGAWNEIGVPASGVYYPLVNLQGQPTAAELYNIGGSDLLVSDDPGTTGDHDALMDDMLIGHNNPVDVCIWVRNLPPGSYEVLIYAMTPNNPSLASRTRVDFADQGPAFIGGLWPGAHALGITYSRHTVTIANDTIGLHSGLFNGFIQSGINGIQIRKIHPGDTNGDAVTNIDDLLRIINTWGACPSNPPHCAADLTGNGVVDIDDLLAVINNWG
jgi:hypothetical protein